MAKMTISALKTFASGYVSAAKQAGSWSASTNNLYGLVDKIGKIVSLKGNFSDKLPELEGDELPAGKTIEETLIDLVLPTVYGASGSPAGVANETNATAEGAYDIVPQYPTIESAAYSYSLGRIKTKITRPYDYIEAGCNDAEQVGELTGDIMWSLQSSISLTRFNLKKYLLGNAITKALALTTPLATTIAIPVDTSTSEAFIKQVKQDVEDASFANEGHCLSGALIGAAPELTLYVKKGVLPVVEVDALAGAFHQENLAIPANVKVVDDFGGADSKVWAFLVDPRGIKLHNSYRAIRSKENADGDFVNFVEHEDNTGFISKHVYMKVYKTA